MIFLVFILFLENERPQDNLEFLQWIMHYHEVQGGVAGEHFSLKQFKNKLDLDCFCEE